MTELDVGVDGTAANRIRCLVVRMIIMTSLVGSALIIFESNWDGVGDGTNWRECRSRIIRCGMLSTNGCVLLSAYSSTDRSLSRLIAGRSIDRCTRTGFLVGTRIWSRSWNRSKRNSWNWWKWSWREWNGWWWWNGNWRIVDIVPVYDRDTTFAG